VAGWGTDGERGACWFADTNRDWILDEQTPVIDLVREGETLRLDSGAGLYAAEAKQ